MGLSLTTLNRFVSIGGITMTIFIKRFFIWSLILLLLGLSACSNNDNSDPSNDLPPINEDSDSSDPIDEDLLPGNELPYLNTFTEEEQILLTTLSYGYASNNGNVSNHGLLTSIPQLKSHFISLGDQVVTFNPESQSYETLFSLETGAHASHLVYNNNLLYFIESIDQHLYAYNFEQDNIELMAEGEFLRLFPYGDRLMVMHNADVAYSDDKVPTYGVYNPSTQLVMNINSGVDHFSTYGNSRNYFKEHNSLRIDVRAPNGAGSRLVNLEDYNVRELHEMFVMYFDQSYISHLVMLATVGNEIGLYVYRSNDVGFVKIDSGNIQHLNYAHNHIYYVMNQSLYKVNEKDLDERSKVMDLNADVDAIFWIDQYFYYRIKGSKDIYVVHPITQSTYKVTAP